MTYDKLPVHAERAEQKDQVLKLVFGENNIEIFNKR